MNVESGGDCVGRGRSRAETKRTARGISDHSQTSESDWKRPKYESINANRGTVIGRRPADACVFAALVVVLILCELLEDLGASQRCRFRVRGQRRAEFGRGLLRQARCERRVRVRIITLTRAVGGVLLQQQRLFETARD